MKLSELRGKSREELLQELEGFKRELLNLRIQWQVGELKNSAQYKKSRKEIARVKTLLRETELGINKELYQKKT
ncbi:MAG TPA: 50S ribosomal protein L29 [Candidatus Hypogeohydataceae bacterium YC41]